MIPRRIAALLLTLLPLASAGEIHLSGSVLDSVGNPVFGARVELLGAEEEAFSSPDGGWSIEGEDASSGHPSYGIDTLQVQWKDAEPVRFPAVTRVQTGRVLVLPLRTAEAPADPRPEERPKPPGRRRASAAASPSLLITDPLGNPLSIPLSQARSTATQYRNAAASQRKVGKGFLVGGGIALGLGGLLMLSSDPEESLGTFLTGATIGTLGLIFVVVSPTAFAMASRMEEQAREIESQLDALPPPESRRAPRADAPRLTLRIPF